MEDKDLLKLANIAVVRQHINYVVNSGMDRKSINPIQKIGSDLDREFVRLLLSQSEQVEVLHSISVVSTTFDNIPTKAPEVNFIKTGEDDEEIKKEPSATRPKIKTSKKAVK